MAHKFNCSVCGKEIVVKWLNPGDPAKCRSCGATMKVPANAASVADDYGAGTAPAQKGPAPIPAAESCATCRYLEAVPTDNLEGVGFCRRYPPRGEERFPEVDSGDWCGEHSYKL